MLLLAKRLDVDSLPIAPTKYVQLMISECHVEYQAICVLTPIASLAQLTQAHLYCLPVSVVNLATFNAVNSFIIQVHISRNVA